MIFCRQRFAVRSAVHVPGYSRKHGTWKRVARNFRNSSNLQGVLRIILYPTSSRLNRLGGSLVSVRNSIYSVKFLWKFLSLKRYHDSAP